MTTPADTESERHVFRPVIEVDEHAGAQLAFLQAEIARGRRCALVAIVGIIGAASRSAGGLMVVCADGRYAGSVSSGCVDANVAAMALKALTTGRAERLTLGAGSPFVDIRLPCGGGLDLLVVPDPEPSAIAAAAAALAERKPTALALSQSGVTLTGPAATTGWIGETFIAAWRPALRLVLAGRGVELAAFCRIAGAAGYPVAAMSPDNADLAACARAGAETLVLDDNRRAPIVDIDPWTAVVLLFHDHDWEAAILKAALESEAFYIGALGSRKTQEQRLASLREAGVDAAALKRIRGPIGLVPSMRNAPMLAISALAEIIDAYNQDAPA